MLEYTGDDMEAVFMQTFQVGYADVFGANLTHDLVPDGAQVPVTRTNVQVRDRRQVRRGAQGWCGRFGGGTGQWGMAWWV